MTMTRIILLISLSIYLIPLNAQKNDWSNFIISEKNGQYGATDSLGNVLVPFKYYSLSPSRNGLANISAGDMMEKTYGKVNKKGEIIIPPIYRDKIIFENERAILNSNDFSGLVNLEGKFLKKIYGGQLTTFGKNYKIFLRNKYGVMNPEGKVIVPIIYDKIENIPYSKAMEVRFKEQIGYLSKRDGSILSEEVENFKELPDTLNCVNYKVSEKAEFCIEIGNKKLEIKNINKGVITTDNPIETHKNPIFIDTVTTFDSQTSISSYQMLEFAGLTSKEINYSTQIKKKKINAQLPLIMLKGDKVDFFIESIYINKIPINKNEKAQGLGFSLRELPRNPTSLKEVSKNTLNGYFKDAEAGDVFILNKIVFFDLIENVPIDFNQSIRIEIK